MTRKLFRTGNSTVVSLPKEALDATGLQEGSEVEVRVDRTRRRIVIAPVEETLPGVDEEFSRQVAEFIERYRPALKKLAR